LQELYSNAKPCDGDTYALTSLEALRFAFVDGNRGHHRIIHALHVTVLDGIYDHMGE
ncbi:hypothetical protein AAVH_43365, partial [Aphelenchoides avenae]